MHVLRAEKGFIIVGQDTDGTVTPYDAGMSWAVAKKKKDFVGMRSLKRSDLVKDGRKQLVGFQAIPMDMLGHVTSSYWSESLERSVAMALVRDGFNLMDKTIYVPMPGQNIEAKVTKPIFYDPKGERLNVV